MSMNLLFFTVDDMNWDTLSAFGGRYGDCTPNLDRFSEQARCFRHAHVNVAVCLPSRSVMMTGRYPHHNGSEGFRAIHPAVPTMPEWLKDQHGYRTGILGKVTHCCPSEKFRWDFQVDFRELGYGRNPDRYVEEMETFLGERDDQPFFLMVNSHDPHRPFHNSDQEKGFWNEEQRSTFPDPDKVYQPEEVEVPGFLPDLPEVRQEVAEYASSCRRCDQCFGRVMEVLEKHGLEEETAVFFLSDNGMAFPFAKTNCDLHSTRTPLMVRWPRRTEPGMDETHMVSGIDLLPTIIEGLGFTSPDQLPHPAWLEPFRPDDRYPWRPVQPTIDGRSFLPLVGGQAQEGRDHVHTVFNRTAARKRYEMRCIQTPEWGYIFNQWSDGETTFRNESMSGRTFNAMKEAAGQDAAVADRVNTFLYRTPEELYEFGSDPDGLDNRVEDPDQQERLQSFRDHMKRWMEETEDALLHDVPF